MKNIGIITTGGDCSGINATIQRIVTGARIRGWRVFGIIDGMDGLENGNIIEINTNNFPVEAMHLAGSMLQNGNPYKNNFEKAIRNNKLKQFNSQLKKTLHQLGFDALILIGGNGSLSLAWATRDIYSDLQLICIPKTIDMDIPMTDSTIGFNTAVQQLTNYCDQLLMTARSHHRWFVVQAMGRDCGRLALYSGIAVGATAILIPEIKFTTEDLIKHIQTSGSDYGVVLVSEGISLRGHSGQPADMISRELNKANISNRPVFPEHFQRGGSTTASDRMLASGMAACALNAIENNETYVMTAVIDGKCKTVSLSDVISSGKMMPDPNIDCLQISNSYIQPDDLLLQTAINMGIYIGNVK
ncbi:MAG: 6-phosphofructokinase [Alphaproteobacteria bacterium]|nr:6-phosphofructokinase [Alphaproteobacteria bacterium]